jgi:hypothetical protein
VVGVLRVDVAAQYAVRLGVHAQGGRVLVEQDVVGGVVAHGNPPPIWTHAHAVRDVEVLLQPDLTVSDRAAAIQPMPGDRVAVVVADQNVIHPLPDTGDRDRAGRGQERSWGRLDKGTRSWAAS